MFYHDAYFYQVYKKGLIKKYLGFQEKNIMCIYRDKMYSFYLDMEELSSLHTKIKEFYFSPCFDNYINDVKHEINQFKRIRNTDIDSLTLHELKEILKNLIAQYESVAALYCVSESYYADFLAKDYNVSTNSILFHKLPTILKAEIIWIKMCLRDKLDVKLIDKYLVMYGYLFNSFNYEIDRKTLIDRYKNTDKKKLIERLDQLESFSKQDIKYSCQIVDRLSTISYYRMELRPIWMQYSYLIDKILKKLYPNIDYINYTVEEILMERFGDDDRDVFYYFSNDSGERLYYNNTYIEKENMDSHSELVGQFGFGKDFSGMALVAETPEIDLQVLKEGIILIIPQLTYSYVPLLDKISGIIVDEGGITSHANIIARELNINIVVGTVYGTKVIKTNDFLSIDMESLKIKIHNS